MSITLLFLNELSYYLQIGRTLSRSALNQQIWEVILHEILNLSWNAEICISKNMALFLYVFRIGPCF